MAIMTSPRIVTSDLVLYMDAGNIKSYPGTGTTCTNLINNGLVGTLTNGVGFTTNYFSFDGTNDYITIPYSPLLTPTSQITFGAWAYLDNWNTSGYRVILSKTQTGGYQLSINESSNLGDGFVGALVYAGGAYRVAKYARSLISPGWHFLCFTFDGRYFRMYLDKTNVNTYDHGSTITISYSNNNSFVIGAEVGSGTAIDGQYWNGRVGQTFVYSRALSAAEVGYNFNAIKNRFGLR